VTAKFPCKGIGSTVRCRRPSSWH